MIPRVTSASDMAGTIKWYIFWQNYVFMLNDFFFLKEDVTHCLNYQSSITKS